MAYGVLHPSAEILSQSTETCNLIGCDEKFTSPAESAKLSPDEHADQYAMLMSRAASCTACSCCDSAERDVNNFVVSAAYALCPSKLIQIATSPVCLSSFLV